jgi:hypothetical protein
VYGLTERLQIDYSGNVNPTTGVSMTTLLQCKSPLVSYNQSCIYKKPDKQEQEDVPKDDIFKVRLICIPRNVSM